MLYDYLNNIERGIKNIGDGYFRPYGWQERKNWKKAMSFSYNDVNRWIYDLNLIIDNLNNESNALFPSETLFPRDNLYPR